jgi:hypothetical protein
MPVNVKQFDEQEGYNNQDEVLGGGGSNNIDDVFIDAGGGGGGGSSSGVSVSTPTVADTFVFTIKSNQTGFTTTVNGNPVPTNQSVRITRESLATEDKLIKISKKGYLCTEYYIVTMVDDDLPIIKNLNVSDTPLGISTKDIVLKTFLNGKEQLPISIRNTTTSILNFNLRRGDDEYEEPGKYKVKFNIGGSGAPVSILKNGNKNAEFFPPSGESEYEDVEGTKYLISSADATEYRITNITLTTADNQPVVLEANPGETLETNITLNFNYEISISLEKVPLPLDELDPQISLVNADPRKYNINEKSGVPLLIQKNADVQAITIIVGDDILEFDDFGKDNYEEGNGDEIVGITIPHNVFSKIGQYNIKLFPFSFDDYENQVREEEEVVTITPKAVTPKFIGIETETPSDPKPINNPYNPPRGGGGGGSGGGQEQFISEEQFGIDRGFGAGNDFDERPGRPNRNLNYF